MLIDLCIKSLCCL